MERGTAEQTVSQTANAVCPPLVIHTDGACSGNPGPASVGVVIESLAGSVLAQIGETIGDATNNEAEYRAVLRALDEAERLGATKVKILSDSQLVVRQIQGQYTCQNERLQVLLEAVRERVGRLKVFRIEWIPREKNKEADVLSAQALGRDPREAEAFNFHNFLQLQDDVIRLQNECRRWKSVYIYMLTRYNPDALDEHGRIRPDHIPLGNLKNEDFPTGDEFFPAACEPSMPQDAIIQDI